MTVARSLASNDQACFLLPVYSESTWNKWD